MTSATDQKEKKDNKKFLILIILLGVLTCFSAFSGYVAFVKNPDKMEELTVETDNHKTRASKLQGEIDKVNSMLENIGFEASEKGIEGFKEEHLALREQAEQQKKRLLDLQDKMKKLIELSEGEAKDADSFIAMYRKIKAEHWALNNEVNKLRKRNKQLSRQNRKLTKENKELNEEMTKQKANAEYLVEERDVLKRKVQKAAILNVYELNAEGIRIVRGGREKSSRNKAKKTEKIRVGFTLPKNDVTTPGTKSIYMVITGPDKQVMTDGGSNFKFEGKNMAYTIKDQVEYNNEQKDLMMYGKNLFKEKFDPGRYKIELYCEGAKIGTTELVLR